MAIFDNAWALGNTRSRQKGFRVSDDKAAVKLGLVLAVVTIVLILIHAAMFHLLEASFNKGGHINKVFWLFDLGREGSFPEIFNHGMLFLCAALMMYTSFETGARAPLLFGAFFIFAWFDDSIQYHERMGSLIAQGLEIPPFFSLRGQDFGEIIAWALALLILTGLAFWAYKGRMRGDVGVIKIMVIPIFLLMFCGSFFDMLHIAIEGRLANLVFTILEDGGEMIAITTAVATSLAIMRNSNKIYD